MLNVFASEKIFYPFQYIRAAAFFDFPKTSNRLEQFRVTSFEREYLFGKINSLDEKSNKVDIIRYHKQNSTKSTRWSVLFQSLELYALLLTDTCFKNGRAIQELTAGDIPDGWNDNHYRLKSAAGAFPAEDYGLSPANLILVDQDRSTFLVECGGKYFFWNDISDDVARIDEPTGLSNILQAMKDSGKLKTVRLEMPGALKPS